MREPYSNELYHFGILGQKWGIRRYQNPDGSLTEAGRKRYGYSRKEKKAIYSNEIAKHHGKPWTDKDVDRLSELVRELNSDPKAMKIARAAYKKMIAKAEKAIEKGRTPNVPSLSADQLAANYHNRVKNAGIKGLAFGLVGAASSLGRAVTLARILG